MKYFLLCMGFFMATTVVGQVYSNKEVGKKNQALKDSLEKTVYPYSLPIWGEKATKKGYSLPYSAGVSVQYFTQVSDLIIDNLQVGFNNGPKYNLDGLVRFDKARATASALTFRPDVWVLPFLNVYGVLGQASASTDVGFGVWIPDSTGAEKKILSAETNIKFKTTTFGLGMTPTLGVGGGFLALDMNYTWTDVPQLSKPATTFVFGPRFGKTFRFKNPERNIAIWGGGFRVKFNSTTDGSINLSEVFPISEFENKIATGYTKVADAQQQVDAWWEGLTPIDQKNPTNVAKHNTADAALAKAGEILSSAETAVKTVGSSTVQYSMDKRPKDAWNFIIGSQFQYNKHWMIRAEYGFMGSRTQFMTGVQYRFGL